MELTVSALLWRALFAAVAIIALLLSRRPTVAQRIVSALGCVAAFGAAWALVLLDLNIFTSFLIAAVAAFGLLAIAEARN